MSNRLSLVRMAEGVRNRQISPIELIQAHLAQIEHQNPRLNAFIEIYADEALDAARRAEDALARRQPLGPLHGVPVTIKDSFDIAGRVTACGSRLRAAETASADAVAVARLRRAGAIILGKTSCPEFLMNYETDNHLIGRTNNPWDLDRTPGGSSGGESAAIASFCSPGGMGSDGGGSIREPAHFCGIAGLKPTPGRVPAAGHWPPIAHPGGLMGVGGPMARTAADVKLLFQAVEGFHPADPFCHPGPAPEPPALPVAVAVMEQFAVIPVMPEMRAAVHKAASLLAQMGYPVSGFDCAPIQSAHDLWRFLFVNVNAPAIRALIDGREAQCHRLGLELIDSVKDQPAPSALDLTTALAARDAMRGRLVEWFLDTPVILAPACGVTAFPHGQRRFTVDGREFGLLDAMAPLTFVNLLGLPSISIPMLLTPEGLPAGIQLIGAPWSEDLLLELAIRLERTRGPFASPPSC